MDFDYGPIEALQLALAARDPYTGEHSTEVADLSKAIGIRIGLSTDSLDALYLAGLVHDLGKIHIPTEILIKPGKLDPGEWMIIQAHPQTAYDILRPLKPPWPLGEIVLQHHERLDGQGYPHKLKGPDIFPEAKILMVADVVDSMARHRPYRQALGASACIEEITTHKGTRYDPAAVDACVAILSEGRP